MRPCVPHLTKSRGSSSSRWLARARNDAFAAFSSPSPSSSSSSSPSLYVARSAHKLLQLDARFKLLRRGATILELGAAPGGWTQVCLERLRGRGRIVAADLLELDSSVAAAAAGPAGTLRFVRGDLRDGKTRSAIRAALGSSEDGNRPASVDVVLSDMLANTSGSREADSARSLELCELVLQLSLEYMSQPAGPAPKLTPASASASSLPALSAAEELHIHQPHKTNTEGNNKTMVLKILQSHEADVWRKTVLQKLFRTVRVVKPDASRKESAECYIVARGLKEVSLGDAEQAP